MTDIFQTLAKLREKYPEDINRIEQDAKRVKELLLKKDFAQNEATQMLIDLCRTNILEARKKLALDKTLLGNESAQRELWFIIESRQWVIDMIARNYDNELAHIETELVAELNA